MGGGFFYLAQGRIFAGFGLPFGISGKAVVKVAVSYRPVLAGYAFAAQGFVGPTGNPPLLVDFSRGVWVTFGL